MMALVEGAAMMLSPTNLLALVSLGLLGGRQGARLTPVILFAFGLLAGSLGVAAALRDPPAGTALLHIAAIAAILVVIAWTPSISGALAFAGGAALALNAPPQAITLWGAMMSQLGAAIAALIAFVAVALVAASAQRPWQHVALRVVASWIAASAILAIALRLAR